MKPSIRMNYLVATPEDTDPRECLPMIVCLHGAGERGLDRKGITVHGIPSMLDKGLPVRAIILAPQVPDLSHVWNNLADETFELIQLTAKEYSADPDRISITGLSMGGYGTWELGIMHSEYFSAMAPIAGGGMPWRAGLLGNIPVRTWHGEDDDVVPIGSTQQMVDALRGAGGKAEFEALAGVKHDSWTYAYTKTDVIEWLVSQRRSNRMPTAT